MELCHSCQTAIDEYPLDKHLEPLRDLTVDGFNVCADCVIVILRLFTAGVPQFVGTSSRTTRSRDVVAKSIAIITMTVVANACVVCGGAVYVPRSESLTPDYCPACRADILADTGQDPGWNADPPAP